MTAVKEHKISSIQKREHEVNRTYVWKPGSGTKADRGALIPQRN